MLGRALDNEEKLLGYLKRTTAELRETKRRLRAVERRDAEPIAIVAMAWANVTVQVPGATEVTVIRGLFTAEGLTWLTENLGWIPFFAPPASGTGRTILTAAIVLAVMVLPIITALSREVFLQTPVLHEEAALALGATRWEMIRTAVLPFGAGGVVSAAMLGLGRALGETVAVMIILTVPNGNDPWNSSIFAGGDGVLHVCSRLRHDLWNADRWPFISMDQLA